MFEVRKSGKTYRVYDHARKRYICNTKNEERANNLAQDLLHSCGFEGEIPDFFLTGFKYGIPLSEK